MRALPCPALLPARCCPHFWELCLPAGTPNPLHPAARVAAGLSPGALGDQCHPAPVCQATRPPRAPLPQPSAKPHAAPPCRAGGEGRQGKVDVKALAVDPLCWPLMPCCWGHSWRGVEVRLRHPTTHWAQGFTCGHKEGSGGTGGVVQGLRSHLPMQKTRVPSLVGDLSPTRPGAAEPACHSEGSRCQLRPETAKQINTRFERSEVKSTPAPRPKEESWGPAGSPGTCRRRRDGKRIRARCCRQGVSPVGRAGRSRVERACGRLRASLSSLSGGALVQKGPAGDRWPPAPCGVLTGRGRAVGFCKAPAWLPAPALHR